MLFSHRGTDLLLNAQPGAVSFTPKANSGKVQLRVFQSDLYQRHIKAQFSAAHRELPVGGSDVNGILLLAGCVQVHLVGFSFATKLLQSQPHRQVLGQVINGGVARGLDVSEATTAIRHLSCRYDEKPSGTPLNIKHQAWKGLEKFTNENINCFSPRHASSLSKYSVLKCPFIFLTLVPQALLLLGERRQRCPVICSKWKTQCQGLFRAAHGCWNLLSIDTASSAWTESRTVGQLPTQHSAPRHSSVLSHYLFSLQLFTQELKADANASPRSLVFSLPFRTTPGTPLQFQTKKKSWLKL